MRSLILTILLVCVASVAQAKTGIHPFCLHWIPRSNFDLANMVDACITDPEGSECGLDPYAVRDKRKRLTVEEYAALWGMTPAALSKALRDVSEPTLVTGPVESTYIDSNGQIGYWIRNAKPGERRAVFIDEQGNTHSVLLECCNMEKEKQKAEVPASTRKSKQKPQPPKACIEGPPIVTQYGNGGNTLFGAVGNGQFTSGMTFSTEGDSLVHHECK